MLSFDHIKELNKGYIAIVILFFTVLFSMGVSPQKISYLVSYLDPEKINSNSLLGMNVYFSLIINLFGTLFFISSTATRFYENMIPNSIEEKQDIINLFNYFSFIGVFFVFSLTIDIFNMINFKNEINTYNFLRIVSCYISLVTLMVMVLLSIWYCFFPPIFSQLTSSSIFHKLKTK
jgi:hypothetical protein